MPIPQRWNASGKKSAPEGFDYVQPVLEALENELRDVVQEKDPTKRKTEAMWPIHQINWQKSRYIYDMYYVHHRISKAVYQYCLDQKLVDAALIAKWKKPGYERLCSTYVINPSNYKFGTTSICRVPWKDRPEEQKGVRDPTTGCLGCASNDAADRNIFGNKYGQYLAAIQIAREQRQQQKEQQQLTTLPRNQDEQDSPRLPPPPTQDQQTRPPENDQDDDDDDDDAPTDVDDDGRHDKDDDDDEDTDQEEDFGPSPIAGIWAGNSKLQRSDNHGQDDDQPPLKKSRN